MSVSRATAAQLAGRLTDQILTFEPTRPVEDNLTPPASWYTEDSFFQLEKETVFSDTWMFVGHAKAVTRPGDYFTGKHIGRPYVVLRDEDGTLRAFYNVCTHHGTCIARGEGTTDKLVCPYHGWTFALDGRLKRAPFAGAIKDLAKKGMNLKPIPVEIWGPFVLLDFSGSSDPASAFLARLSAQPEKLRFAGLSFVHRVSYTIDCNWKVFIDNYLDGGYHVPLMHPELASGLDLDKYRSQIGDVYSIQSCPSGDKGDERLGEDAHYTWIYPNFAINRYGSWMDTNLVLPLGPDRCVTVFDYFHEGPIGDEELARAVADSDQVQQEDIEICDLVQVGLGSGAYDRGIYAPRFEGPMYHFHTLLAADFRRALDADERD